MSEPEHSASMSTISHSRLFKATRRFIVAEITLIIVIVILFTWSTYVLYKLFAGDTDTLFGLNFSASSPSAKSHQFQFQIPRNGSQSLDELNSANLRENPSDARLASSNQLGALVDRNNLQEQLANYKEQILKALLARQRTILGTDNGAGTLQSMLDSRRQNNQIQHHENHLTDSSLVGNAQNWRGNTPNSLNYLFKSQQKAVPPERFPSSSTVNVHSSAPVVAKPPTSLVYLHDAPSLMQLSPTTEPSESDYHRTTTTTRAPDTTPPAVAQFSDNQDGNQFMNEQINQQNELQSTTTELPPSESENETTTLEPINRDDDNDNSQDGTQGVNSSEPESAEIKPERGDEEREDSSSGDKNPEPNEQRTDDEQVKNTVKVIDEEVDRMTQPSLGVVSQEGQPATDLRGTVLFDDGGLQDEDGDRSSMAKANSHKTPTRKAGKARSSDKNRRIDHEESGQTVADLLVADNLNKSPVSSSLVGVDEFDRRSQDKLIGHLNRPASPDAHVRSHEAIPRQVVGQVDTAMGTKSTSGRLSRTKRSMLALNDPAAARHKRTKKRRRNKSINSARRSDEDSDDEDDDEEDNVIQDNEQDSEQLSHEPLVVPESLPAPPTPTQPTIDRKQYTPSDPSFEELLAHKQLLDALQQNQLPSPIGLPATVQASSQNHQSNNRSAPIAGNPIDPPKKSGQGDDHQSADTHYSVDHGLLLYPSSNEEHHHKSKAHKSSKASKKKDKKKMTVAVKKGGHKSKKHKKEEKKYHKEKKFKGAKKGKKMKKGKGGKGGKKGKKLYKDKGYKKKGFKKTYVKNEFGSKKSYFDEFRDKDFKKKWKNFDDKYNYAQMKKWQAKDVKKAKKMKDHGEKFKKYDKGKWQKKKFAEMSSGSKKSKSKHEKDF
jgi:hypothetical protein